MKTTRLLPAILATLAGVTVMLAGCGARDGGSDQLGDTPVLNRALSTEPESLDPQKSRSVQAADVLRDIGEGLVSYDAGGAMVPATAGPRSERISPKRLLPTTTSNQSG